MKVKKYIAKIEKNDKITEYPLLAYSRSDAHARMGVIAQSSGWYILSISEHNEEEESVEQSKTTSFS